MIAQKGGFQLQPWDWDFYSEQVRKAKYDIDEAQVRPYFELNNVLQNGVFYAANQMYGLTFKERKDIPVYAPDVRVFEVFEASGKPLALFYCDYFKRDNKGGGAWMSTFVDQSKLLGTLPVIYNVANFAKPAAGEPALISFTDVTTMFHEFGHGLHGMFSNVEYPLLSGTNVPRDFVEFPSQFNEHWASYPAVFDHFAKHYKTGAPMPAELAAKLRKADKFNQGYMLTELLAAAELDMQWHTISAATAPLQNPDAFETGGAGAEEDCAGDGASALPVELLHAHMERRLCGGILRVSVERDAGRQCVPVVRGAWRADARQRRALPQDGAVEGIYRGAGEDVRGVAGRRADSRADAEAARAGGGWGREVGLAFAQKIGMGY